MPNGVLIFAEFRGNSIKRVTYEMISAAKPLAAALGGPVQVVFVGGAGLADAAPHTVGRDRCRPATK